MSTDLRFKHDAEKRERACRLFEAGYGVKSVAGMVSAPRRTVEKWQYLYRAFGSEVLLAVDGKQLAYTYEQRVAAASAVVDGGMTRPDAMKAFGIKSLSPLERWCKAYREGGAEALRPKPKGRPGDRGPSRASSPARRSSRTAAAGSRPRWPT